MDKAKLKDTRLRSYADLYMVLVETFGEDDAKTVMPPIIDVSVEIAWNRLVELCARHGINIFGILEEENAQPTEAV